MGWRTYLPVEGSLERRRVVALERANLDGECQRRPGDKRAQEGRKSR